MNKVSTGEEFLLIYQKRNQAIVYLTLAIIFMIILGIGLPDLQFLPGLPIPGTDGSSVNIPTTPQASDNQKISSQWTLQVGFSVGFVLVFILIIIALLKNVNFKLVVLLTGVLVILFAVFRLLPDFSHNQLEPLLMDTTLSDQQFLDYQVAPIEDPPANLIFWVKVGLAFAGIFIISWLIARVSQRSQNDNELAAEVKSAIQAISNGANLGGVIIECYLNMEKIISQEQGIDRDKSMTPHEFEVYLTNKGIPEAPIQQLTTLFEKARYGNQFLTEQDEFDALSSLSVIRNICQFVVKGNQ